MTFENTIYTFLNHLNHFDYDISYSDYIWTLIFPDSKGKWRHVVVTKYQEKYFMTHVESNICSLEVVPKKSVQVMNSSGFSHYQDHYYAPELAWGEIVKSANHWLKIVKKGLDKSQ